MKPQDTTADYPRLLKPTALLTATISMVIVGACIAIAAAFEFGVLILFAICMFSPLSLAPLVGKLLSARAEQRRVSPNVWFKADSERECELYGPVRAFRLFGHKYNGTNY